jgi:hypothetical protein
MGSAGSGASPSASLALALALASCSALPNPPPPTRPAEAAKVEAPPAPSPEAQRPAEPVPSAAQESAAPAPLPAGKPAPLPIARVAGKDIDVAELLGLWLHQDSLQVLEHLDHLVLGRLVLAEAARLSVAVDPEASEAAYKKAVETIEKTIGAKRPGLTLDRYVDEALGLDPVRYREFLRDESLRGLLAERVVRAWILGSERCEVRVIAVKTEEASREVREALAAGEAFEEVARRLSADASSKDGGRVPPVVRGDSPIARLAFQTEIGQVGGPQYEKGAWLFEKVEARPVPVTGEWKVVGPAVLKSLAESPVLDLEVSQWKPEMVERYGVDITPLMRIVE